MLILVYGPPIIIGKACLKKSLISIRALIQAYLCIIGGDFNMINSLQEKREEGTRRVDKPNLMFKDNIQLLILVEINTLNGIHAWNNMRGGKHQIIYKIDIFYFYFGESSIKYIIFEASIFIYNGTKHWLISLQLNLKETPHNFPFSFEGFFLQDATLVVKVKG